MDQVIEWGETWQVRALVHARGQHVGLVLLSVLAKTYDDAMPVMLRAAFPGFISIAAPFLCSDGRIGKSGQVMADVVQPADRIDKDVAVYRNETALRDDFRRLADELKLSDDDRIEMFKCVQRWVVADRRLDPTFDPQDPDAKRLIH